MASTKNRTLPAKEQVALKQAIQGTSITLKQASDAYRQGTGSAEQIVKSLVAKADAEPKPVQSGNGQAIINKVLAQATEAKEEKVTKVRTPRKTAVDQIMAAAEQGGWDVAEVDINSPEVKAIPLLNPRRGKRIWAANITRGTAKFFVTTIIGNLKGSVHLDKCLLVQGDKTIPVYYIYEVVGTLAGPADSDGTTRLVGKDEGRKRMAKVVAGEKVSA